MVLQTSLVQDRLAFLIFTAKVIFSIQQYQQPFQRLLCRRLIQRSPRHTVRSLLRCFLPMIPHLKALVQRLVQQVVQHLVQQQQVRLLRLALTHLFLQQLKQAGQQLTQLNSDKE